MKEKIDAAEKEKEEITLKRNKKLNAIGNLVYNDVPISKDEENNAVASTWG